MHPGLRVPGFYLHPLPVYTEFPAGPFPVDRVSPTAAEESRSVPHWWSTKYRLHYNSVIIHIIMWTKKNDHFKSMGFYRFVFQNKKMFTKVEFVQFLAVNKPIVKTQFICVSWIFMKWKKKPNNIYYINQCILNFIYSKSKVSQIPLT